MHKLLSIFSVAMLICTIAFGQAAIDIPLTITDSGSPTPQVLQLGLDVSATDCIDPALGEAEAPPFPPAGAFAIVFDLEPYGCGALTVFNDYRPATFPFTGVVQHSLKWQKTSGAASLQVAYNVPTGATITIQDPAGGILLNLGPFTGSGTTTIPASYVFTNAFVIMNYTNIAPVGPAPEFSIAPASLSFPPTGVGLTSTLQATVSNPGTDPLEISNIVSSDGQFTFAPNTFPISVPAGGNQVFDVTFSPTALGSFSANLTFTHNAPGSPFDYPVQGVGADAGPTFAVTPTSLTFPTVIVGNSNPKILTVSNNGLSNTLNITSVVSTNATDYSVTPATATIAPGANQVFTVTFAPQSGGTLTTDIVFTHDGPGPTTTVPATGEGFEPPAVNGLVFSEDTAFVPENTYDLTATLQLLGLPTGSAVHALQFKLQSNMVVDDDVILTFQSIKKSGSIATNPNWILETNVVRGSIQPNGASEDLIYVLLYNIGTGALTGDYTNLMQVTYKTAVLPPLTPFQKSSFNIIDATGSNVEGNEIIITPSDPTLEVIVEAAGGTYGDVNGDGCVDILDLIMVVDHIVGRDSLVGDEFLRADLAPWPGTPEPAPDGLVNVQDLSVIQSIILTGQYPNGDPVTPCGYLSKSNGPTEAKVTLYINEEGISAYVDADIGLRGAQIEFTNISDDPNNLVISTPLGQGYYQLAEGLFRTVMYDRAGQKSINAGVNNFMADMPFALNKPQDVTVAKIVLVDMNVQKLGNIQVQIVYGSTILPLDYVLFQNYPNPFNPTTAIQFQVPKTSDVKIAVYDMLGQEIRTLVAGEVLRGTYTVDWDGFNNDGEKVSSGTYIYRMTAGEFVQSKKMVLIK